MPPKSSRGSKIISFFRRLKPGARKRESDARAAETFVRALEAYGISHLEIARKREWFKSQYPHSSELDFLQEWHKRVNAQRRPSK